MSRGHDNQSNSKYAHLKLLTVCKKMCDKGRPHRFRDEFACIRLNCFRFLRHVVADGRLSRRSVEGIMTI
jgi:hypothetical protein